MRAAVTAGWPEPYLQPDRAKDCGFYAAAYVARCLGYLETTAEQVKAWRAETSRTETYFASLALGAEIYGFWDAEREGGEQARRPFWLGPRFRQWVTDQLDARRIAQVMLNRIAGMGHAAVVLGYSGDGVLLMDPIYGHITEPWEWFLGPGSKDECADWPGKAPDGRQFFGAHLIEAWYQIPGSPLPG